MKKVKTKWTRWFKINSESREFMYYTSTSSKKALAPFIKHIKKQGDLYRVTKWKHGYELWDARP